MPIFTCILTYNLNRNWSFFFNFFFKKTFYAILFLVCLPPSPDHTPPPRVEKGAVRSNAMPPSSLESFSHAQTSTYNTPSPPSPPPIFFPQSIAVCLVHNTGSRWWGTWICLLCQGIQHKTLRGHLFSKELLLWVRAACLSFEMVLVYFEITIIFKSLDFLLTHRTQWWRHGLLQDMQT